MTWSVDGVCARHVFGHLSMNVIKATHSTMLRQTVPKCWGIVICYFFFSLWVVSFLCVWIFNLVWMRMYRLDVGCGIASTVSHSYTFECFCFCYCASFSIDCRSNDCSYSRNQTKVIQMNFQKFISTLKFNVITVKWLSSDVQISKDLWYQKNPIKFG